MPIDLQRDVFGTGLAGTLYQHANPRAVLVIVHGLAEHRGRYDEAGYACLEKAVTCFTYDARGHGESPGPRAHIRRFSEFVQDLGTIVSGIAGEYPEVPIFLWGHSMGSIVALDYALQPHRAVAAAITTGCPLAISSRPVRKLSPALAAITRWLPVVCLKSMLDPALLSHRKSVQTAYRRDPLVTHSMSVQLILGLLATAQRVRKLGSQMTLPVLVVHGEHDQIAPAVGSRQFFELAGSTDRRLMIMKNLRHEVHNESLDQRMVFYGELFEWIALHTAKTAT